ncbi:probable LRR receptor-like serine/threonine-protein kinase At1g53430 [Nymphaea colorata]|nr:probable LRR receptor-like serine/threonine-protein kinase At1g53430 [Nymphaea colorata]
MEGIREALLSPVLLLASFLLLLALQCSSQNVGSLRPKLPDDEVAALRVIGSKLGKKDWNFSVDPCSGSGGWISPALDPSVNNVTCDCSDSNGTICHIVSIILKAQNLAGTLPEELSKLKYLRGIDLTRNYINGTIPTSWASLPLVALNLTANRVSGRIPKELGSMTALEVLEVEANQLEGQLPPELGNLASLRRLVLNSNKFTGEFPSALANLMNMNAFYVSGSNFTGKIPDFISKWTQLQFIMIMGTSMEGPIPSSLSSLKNLKHLIISDLSGPGSSFPPLQNMKSLTRLILRNCSISGEIPSYIGGLPGLRILDLSFNNLTGQIPPSFSSFTSLSLQYMFLRNNQLTGPIPEWVYKVNKNLDLSENNFTGATSSTICPQQNLNLVSSFSSTDDSSVPACLRKDYPCSDLEKYSSLFINCGGTQLVVNGTTYEADIEPSGESTYYHSAGGNWAMTSTGVFMDTVTAGPFLVANKSRLLMSNPTLYMTARVAPIMLTYYGLCMQKGDYTVQLHFSEIIFTNDQTFSSLGERVFDVFIQHEKVLKDFNIARENGGTQKEVIKSFNASVTEGTLQISLYWGGKGTLAIPSRGNYGPLISAISVYPNFKPKDYDKDEALTAIIIAIVIVVCLIVVVLVILRAKCCRGDETTLDKELKDLDKQNGYFSLHEIKEATKDFHPENKIGHGSSGPVYKGIMRDGTQIAVKQLSSISRQGNREFLNEIGMVSALQHPNLVKLFGYCIQGNELMLIYEYMENNSLSRALFGSSEHRSKLDWPTRCKICIGVAKGLAYLHEESPLKVIHRDIKAMNILLDKDLNAKISDFGLAKLDEGDKSHISTHIVGTTGYIAPEYAIKGQLSYKADVFSYGVVVLEVVSGESNTYASPREEFPFLLDWAYDLQEKRCLLELADPCLGPDFSEAEALKMLNIALLCTNSNPSLRPTMSSVVDMLEGRTAVCETPDPSSSSSNGAVLGRVWRSGGLSQDEITQDGFAAETLQVSEWRTWPHSNSVCTTEEQSVLSQRPLTM